MGELFDDITRIVASPIPRRRAAQLVVSLVAGVAMGTGEARRAAAGECSPILQNCPAGQDCLICDPVNDPTDTKCCARAPQGSAVACLICNDAAKTRICCTAPRNVAVQCSTCINAAGQQVGLACCGLLDACSVAEDNVTFGCCFNQPPAQADLSICPAGPAGPLPPVCCPRTGLGARQHCTLCPGGTTFCCPKNNAGVQLVCTICADPARTKRCCLPGQLCNAALQCCAPPAAKPRPVMPGPPTKMQVEVRDADSGLLSIDVTVAINVAVDVPIFLTGTTDVVLVTATKIDQTKSARFELRICNVCGVCILADPVLLSIDRQTGKPVSHAFSNIPFAESKVTITNGAPGLQHLDIAVNEKTFKLNDLRDGEVRTLSVSSAMVAGNENAITMTARGKPGGSAMVLISE